MRENLIVFADEHREACPQTMQRLHEQLCLQGYEVVDCFFDLKKLSALEGMRQMISFMSLYAQASFVILQDNFLPVSSCRKRRKTTVIQLWHGCGAFKRFGYDAQDDIPRFYKGNVYRNYDLVTVSSPYCRPFFTSAMRIRHPKTVRAFGSSYTDCYYDAAYAECMRNKFEQYYGSHDRKKVIVWAPTFRGNAGQQEKGTCYGETFIDQLAENPDYLVIKSLHPHMQKETTKQPLTTGELLFSADILITDYSSVLFEYLLLNKPLVFFAPDLPVYKKERGWYLQYEDLPGEIVTEGESLDATIRDILREDTYETKRTLFRKRYMSRCDGNATQRICEYIHRTGEKKFENAKKIIS